MGKQVEKRIQFIGYDYHKNGARITDRFGVSEKNIVEFVQKVAKIAKEKERLPEAMITVLEQDKDAGGVLLALATIQVDIMLQEGEEG